MFFSKKRIFLLVAIFSIISLFVLGNMYSKVNIVFKNGNVGDDVCIFYDTLDSNTVFDDNHLKIVKIKSKDSFQKNSVYVPKKNLNKLRFDFGNNQGKTVIDSIEVNRNFFLRIVYRGDEIIETFNQTNDIVDYKVEENGLVSFNAIGNDNHIYSLNAITKKSELNIFRIFKLLLLILTVIILYIIGFKNRRIFNNCIKSIRGFFTYYVNKLKTKKISLNPIQILLAGTVIAIFFALPVMFTFDSAWYHLYLDVFEGNKGINQWDPTRGWPFPLLIFLSSRLFGLTSQGIIITMFIFFSTMIYFSYKIFCILNKNKDFKKGYICILFLIFLVFNPIVLGYYHTILTEFCATTLSIINLYIVLKTHKQLIENNVNYKGIYIKRIVCFTFFCVISYFLKQMFLACIILPFVASEFLLIINKFSVRKVISTLSMFVVMFTVLLISISAWNKITDSENGETFFGNKTTIGSSLLSNYIIEGAHYFDIAKIDGSNKVKVIAKEDGSEVTSFEYIPESGVKGSIKYLISCLLNSPKTLIKGYIDNYLVMSNVYSLKDPGINGYSKGIVVKDFQFFRGAENFDIAASPRYFKRGLILYNEQNYDKFKFPILEQYKQAVDSSIVQKIIYNKFFIKFADFLYTSILLLALPMTIFSLIMIIRNAKDGTYIITHTINFIVSSSIFFYALAMSFIGMIIDRYAFPVYIFGIILWINFVINLSICLIKKYRRC